MQTMEQTVYKDPEEFIKDYNKLRKASKNKWYFFKGLVCGKEVKIKSFGTWNQIFKVSGLRCSELYHKTVKSWKSELRGEIGK